ncbi:MAG: hypothetical protein ACLQVI_35895 [Polyangiaceae bacterium]
MDLNEGERETVREIARMISDGALAKAVAEGRALRVEAGLPEGVSVAPSATVMPAAAGRGTLRPFLTAVREVASARHELLVRLRAALEGGAHDEALRVARQLVGLADAAR